METIESRLAALEKLYADKSLELATCRLDVAVLQDLFIIWQRIVTGEDASALEGLVEKLPPSEPTSAAARQLLGLPVKEVRMQEEPEPKQREYPALTWGDVEVDGIQKCYLGTLEIGYVYLGSAKIEIGGYYLSEHNDSVEFNPRLWLLSKFREWFDSLFDQPQ